MGLNETKLVTLLTNYYKLIFLFKSRLKNFFSETGLVYFFWCIFNPLMISTAYLSTQNLHKVNKIIVCVNMNEEFVRA